MDPKEGEGRRAARVERRLRGTDDAPSRSAWTSTSGSISPRTTRADARARRDIDRVCARAHPLRRIHSGAPPRRAVRWHGAQRCEPTPRMRAARSPRLPRARRVRRHRPTWHRCRRLGLWDARSIIRCTHHRRTSSSAGVGMPRTRCFVGRLTRSSWPCLACLIGAPPRASPLLPAAIARAMPLPCLSIPQRGAVVWASGQCGVPCAEAAGLHPERRPAGNRSGRLWRFDGAPANLL
jgi:hypothetical protein